MGWIGVCGTLPMGGVAADPPPLVTNDVPPPLVIVAPQPLVSPVITGPTNLDLVPNAGAVFPPWPTNALLGNWISIPDWASQFALPAPRRVGESPQPSYEVRGPGGRAIVRIGSNRATVRGVDVMLTHLPQFSGGEPALHRLDLQKTFHPLLWPVEATLTGLTNRVIVLDPGHGGKDVGTAASDGRHFEKNLTLDWAVRLKPLLEQQGFRVILTRTNDTEISLAGRVLVAEENAAGLFVSLHFNSAHPVNGRRGLETYALTPPGMPSTVVRDSEDNVRLAFPNNAHDPANLQLAWHIQKATVESTRTVDHGVQRARFLGVLRGQNRPAVLVEGGYLSNPEESRRICDPAYRQKLAEGVAAGIRELVRASMARLDGDPRPDPQTASNR